MSSLVQSSKGNYYAQFYRADRTPSRRQVPLKTKDKRNARKAQRVVEDLVATGKLDPWVSTDYIAVLYPPPPRKLTVRSALDEFLAAKERAGRSADTLRTYRQLILQFDSYLSLHGRANLDVSGVSPELIAEWLDSTLTNVTSRHKMRRHLSAFLAWTAKQNNLSGADGGVYTNPAKDVELGKLPRKHPKHLTFAEVEQLLVAVRAYQAKPRVTTDVTWIVPLIRCNIELGLRAKEVCDLSWSNVDFGEGLVRVHASKGHADRTIPLSPYVASTLKRLKAKRARALGVQIDDVPRDDFVFKSAHTAGRLCRRHLSRRFKHFVRLALPSDRARDVSFHGTRHSAASFLAQAGKSAEFVRDYMGHSSIQVTAKYMHLQREQTHREAIAVFESLESAPGA